MYRVCSSGEEGHAHLLFSASAVYSTKRMGPMFPIILRSLCLHTIFLCPILLGLEKSKIFWPLRSRWIINSILIVISKFLKRYSEAKRTRPPAYSRALRRIKGEFSKGGSREVQVRFPEYQEGRGSYGIYN